MRIVFFGSGAFGLPTLNALFASKEHDVVLAVSQPDRPAGRRRQMTATPIADAVASRGIPCLKPENVNDPDVVRQIHDLNADAYVVIAFGQKLGEPLLAETFAINLHGSLLPKYRGAAPINWAMINNEPQTGVTVITLAQRMDAGLMLRRVPLSIRPDETAGQLHDRLSELGPDAILDVLASKANNSLHPMEQSEAHATRAPKLSKRDGTVSFTQSCGRVRARVHGLNPWPGCTVRIEGTDQRLRLGLVRDQPDAEVDAPPGTVIGDGHHVACASGSVELIRVQPPGRTMMSIDEYLRGHAVRSYTMLVPISEDPADS